MDTNIDILLDEFKEKFGFELIEKNEDLEYWVFERKTELDETHRLILEDHRWELAMDGFNPKKDIGDWLIFSELTDSERDWFGRFIETQYPLTYAEYKFIEKIIQELEKREKEDEM